MVEAEVGGAIADLMETFDGEGRNEGVLVEGGESGAAVWGNGEGFRVGVLEAG